MRRTAVERARCASSARGPFLGSAAMTARAALLALAALGACTRAERPAAGAPNVLLITIDTLRADRLGFMGDPRPTSPALDAFAAGAVVFEDAQASSSWTLPAMASVMTGESPAAHRCETLGSVLDDGFTTLAERLLGAGWDTACVVSHLFVTSRYGLQQGFVHTDDAYAYPEVDPAINVTSQVISDNGIRFLDQTASSPDQRPWFLWLHYFDPHEQYVDHPGISDELKLAGDDPASDLYDGEIRYTDLHVGRVLERLAQLGLAEHTVVVVTADHGDEFHEHGATGHGHTLFSELLHVPFAIRAPGIAPRRVSALARQIDVVPTVLALAGLAPDAGLPGRSLVPLMRGEPADEVGALSELHNGAYQLDAWRKGRFKLIRGAGDAPPRLYDVVADPLERVDVAAQHPDVVRALGAELDAEKERERARGAALGAGGGIALTPGVEQDLHALGYGGARPGEDGSR